MAGTKFFTNELAVSGGNITAQTLETDLSGMANKGYDFVRGAGAGFTASLDGSVGRKNWTQISALAASAQGVIPDNYNFVRVVVSVAGAEGTGTSLILAGIIQ